MERAAVFLFLGTLALLPWATFPPFPWLHEHAQWSDLAFAACAAGWGLARLRGPGRPPLRPAHVAALAYVAWAVVSHLLSVRPSPSGPAKLLGMAELAAFAIVTPDLVARPGVFPRLGRVVAWTSLATSLAAMAGVALFAWGVATPLLDDYGDLEPGHYARARAGLYDCNLLGSYGIFAAGVVLRREASLPLALSRATLLALLVAELLTFGRGVLGFVLVLLVARASRRAALAAALVLALVVATLTLAHVSLDPTRPFAARLLPGPGSRLESGRTSFSALLEHPLLGVGPGRSPGLREGTPMDAHLTPLNVAATLGLPALAAFTAIPVLLWAGRRRPADPAAWGTLAGLALDALAQDIEDFRHLWVAFGLVPQRDAGTPAAARASSG
jgi:hypothetical protein